MKKKIIRIVLLLVIVVMIGLIYGWHFSIGLVALLLGFAAVNKKPGLDEEFDGMIFISGYWLVIGSPFITAVSEFWLTR